MHQQVLSSVWDLKPGLGLSRDLLQKAVDAVELVPIFLSVPVRVLQRDQMVDQAAPAQIVKGFILAAKNPLGGDKVDWG